MIAVAMTGVYPAIVPANEIVDHAMRILMFKRAQVFHLLFRLSIAVSVRVLVYIRNTVHERAVINGEHANRNIQRINKMRKAICFAVMVGIFQYSKPVFPSAGRCSEWIFERLCYPKPA